MSTGPLLRVTGLAADVGTGQRRRRVLEDVQLVVRAQQSVAIIGRSGCGKSTLLRCLIGLHPVAAGEVALHVGGRDGADAMAYMSQADDLLSWRTVLSNLTTVQRGLTSSERRTIALRHLEAVGLADQHALLPGQLSGGGRRRLMLARAMVRQPELLLLDEPFSALDWLTRHTVLARLAAYRCERGVAMLFVTHDLDEAAREADRVLILGDEPARVLATVESGPNADHEATVSRLRSELRELGGSTLSGLPTRPVPARG